MLYFGIDIGKRNHEATILDKSGKELCESIKFSNSKKISWGL
jgi:predicted NBD/HSP70 family sugar kinase